VAKRLHEETADSVYINQYFNELNSEAHYLSTGPEIWEQTDGKVTHVVVASGTGGTISGVGKYLKEKNPAIKVLGVDAYGSILKKFHETSDFDTKEIYPYRIEGLGKNLIPSATNFEVIDVFEKVTDESAAHKARELALEEGLFTGYTSGAVMQATVQYAEKGYFDKNSMVVLLLPDHGSRYMEKIYCDEWMRDQGFFDTKQQEKSALEIIR
jgi:cystathionine beta-synthase